MSSSETWIERDGEVRIRVGDSGLEVVVTWFGSHLISVIQDSDGRIVDDRGEGLNL